MAHFYGRVLSVRHQKEGFTVFEMSIEDADPETEQKTCIVSGSLSGLAQVKVAVPLGIIGDWVEHPKYGRQVRPYGWMTYARSTRDIDMFLGNCLSGFEDAGLRKTLLDRFGTGLYDKLNDDPDALRSLFGADDPKRMVVDRAIQRWCEAASISALSVFLKDQDIGSGLVQQVHAAFGVDAIHTISKNPYRLISVDGFTFARADRVAQRTGIHADDPRRIEGAILWILRQEAQQQGHLFVRRGDLLSLLNTMAQQDFIEAFANLTQDAVMAAVDRLLTGGAVKLDPQAGVYLDSYYRFERDGARKLAAFIRPSKLDVDLDAFLSEYERGHAIELSEAQRQGIRLFVENHVVVITGLPGTGKTTLLRAIVALLKEARITHALMAPTGIAAKRLAAVAQSDASTVHRALGYTGERWGFNGYNKFSVGAVVVDEVSMVDQELFYRLLDALHSSTMLVLVGDDAQLPSVGPGNVLRELVSCKSIPHVRLTQIFRQAERSDIVRMSHRINQGEDLVLESQGPDSDFQFVGCSDENLLCDLVVKMAEKLKGRNANFQVLVPKYDGIVGVNNLNDLLRDVLNPDVGRAEWRAGKLSLRVGDRVMITKNDYTLGVYNGDVGKIDAIGVDDLVVRVHGFDRIDMPVVLTKTKALEMVRLAYAITVHRCQGNEFDTIILPLVRAHGRMRQRNLFYTAVTRARKKCWILGDPASVQHAIRNDKVVQRNTMFGSAISECVLMLDGVEACNGRIVETVQRDPSHQPDGGTAGTPPETSGEHQG